MFKANANLEFAHCKSFNASELLERNAQNNLFGMMVWSHKFTGPHEATKGRKQVRGKPAKTLNHNSSLVCHDSKASEASQNCKISSLQYNDRWSGSFPFPYVGRPVVISQLPG